jgi:hypothetical protein
MMACEVWRHTVEQLSRQTPEVQKYIMPSRPGDWTRYGGTYCLWVLGFKPDLRQLPRTWNCKLDPTLNEIFLHLWCRLLAKSAAEIEVLRDLTEVRCDLEMNFWAADCKTFNCVYRSQHTLRSARWLLCKFYASNSVPVSLQIYLQTMGGGGQWYLIPYNWVLLEELPITQLINKCQGLCNMKSPYWGSC